MPSRSVDLVSCLALALSFTACAHSKTARVSPPDTAAASPTAGGTDKTPPEHMLRTACTADTECGPKQICLNEQCVDVNTNLAACGAMRIHFQLDSSELQASDRTLLERAARCLRAAPGLHVAIEGNADERGTDEYNVALGDRRAQAVARYLESLGATREQLDTVSYGKENPLCQEHDEACWAKNRRAAVKPKQR